MRNRNLKPVVSVIALSLGLVLAGCTSDGPNNTSLYSVKQPVVERMNYTLDLQTGANGLSISEQQRLRDWFDSMGLRYGDRVAIDAPVASEAVREDVAALTGRHGLLLSDGAPVTEGFIEPGRVRIVVTRSRASVPGCPDWSDNQGMKLGNETDDGYGCAINSNLAAMVADPEHLLHGAESTGQTVVMSSTKAIQTYREATPTGAEGLAEVQSNEGGGS